MHPAASQYEFTEDWFSQAASVWERLFSAPNRPPIRRVLEIGSFEGRSTTWIIENVLAGGGEIHCIDTWLESDEHQAIDVSAVEVRFDKNSRIALAKKPDRSLVKHKGTSKRVLARLIAEGLSGGFDFIYIDGSHAAPDVLADLVLCFELCRVEGLIICDDYLWQLHPDPLMRPKWGVDSFVNCYNDKISIWDHLPLYQLYFQKTKE